MNPGDGICGKTHEQTPLLWFKVWESARLAGVGSGTCEPVGGQEASFGIRAPTILGSLKIGKSKKNSPDLKTFLWKTPQPRPQTLLETLLTLNAHVAEEIDRPFL